MVLDPLVAVCLVIIVWLASYAHNYLYIVGYHGKPIEQVLSRADRTMFFLAGPFTAALVAVVALLGQLMGQYPPYHKVFGRGLMFQLNQMLQPKEQG